jgi:hypothetical protein
VFPVLAGDHRAPDGTAAAYRWPDAVLNGLLQQCRRIALERPDFGVGARLEPAASYPVTMLTAAGRRVEAFAATGMPGVPMVAVALDGRLVAAEPGTSSADALDRALDAALLAHQSAVEDQPVYAPPPVPDSAVPSAPGGAAPSDDEPVDGNGIVGALHRGGRTVTAVPLDHDPEVSRIMPNLVAVVVTP